MRALKQHTFFLVALLAGAALACGSGFAKASNDVVSPSEPPGASGIDEFLYRSRAEEGESADPIRIETARPTDADSLGADSLPEISVQFVPGAVDPATVRVFVNDIDVTANAEIDAFRARFVPAQPFPEGRQRVQVQVADESVHWNFRTATAPAVTIAPYDITLPAGARPTIKVVFSDIGLGIDGSRTRLFIRGGLYVDSTDVTDQSIVTSSEITFVPPEPLAEDVYFIDAEVSDLAGNAGLGKPFGQFQVGGAPRFLSVEPDPDNVVLLHGTPKQVRVHFDIGSSPLLNYRMGVDMDDDVEPQLEQNADGTYTLSHLIPESAGRNHCFSVEVRNTATLYASAERCFSVDIQRRREIEVLSPAADAVLSEGTIEVRLRALDDGELVDDVVIDGRDALIELDRSTKPAGYRYHVNEEVALEPGENLIDIEVRFDNGEIEQRQIRVQRTVPPSVQIDAPND
ncbi:MAG: hypothetical protein IPK97_02300 [Ahniella sp.]|nr:hypothetical protein [Ahniella sp.]